MLRYVKVVEIISMNYFSYIYRGADKIICLIISALALLSVLMIGSTSVDTSFLSRNVIIQIAMIEIGRASCRERV